MKIMVTTLIIKTTDGNSSHWIVYNTVIAYEGLFSYLRNLKYFICYYLQHYIVNNNQTFNSDY